MPMGGCHGMAVNKTMRQGAKAKAGDVVDVVMGRDEEARTVEAPPELKRELAKSQKAQLRWDDLAFTDKKELAISIRAAKQEETRKRRLAKLMQVLKTGRTGPDECWTRPPQGPKPPVLDWNYPSARSAAPPKIMTRSSQCRREQPPPQSHQASSGWADFDGRQSYRVGLRSARTACSMSLS
jgi:hypothetical protein